MKRELATLYKKILAILFVFCLSTFLPLQNVLGSLLPTYSLNGVGEVVEVEKEIEKQVQTAPEPFLQSVKDDIFSGRLTKLSYLGKPLIKAMPENADVKALNSIFLISSGKVEDAKNELLELKTANMISDYYMFAEAMIKQREKNYSEAITICQKAINAKPSHPYPHNILGRIYVDLENYGKAVEQFTKAIELNPSFLPGYVNLGAVSYSQGRYEASIQYFQKALDLAQNSFEAHYGLAITYQTLGNNRLALSEYQRSHNLNPDRKEILNEIGSIQVLEGQYADAEQTAKQLLESDPDSGHLLLGAITLYTGKTDEAIVHFNKITKQNTETMFLIGYSNMVSGNYPKAMHVFEESSKIKPKHFPTYLAKASLSFYLNDNNTLPIVTSWPDNNQKSLHFLVACIRGATGDWKEAEQHFHLAQDVIKGFSINGITEEELSKGLKESEMKHLILGLLFQLNNFSQKAIDELGLALKINTDSILSNYLIAQSFLEIQQRDKAIIYLENSLKAAPNFFSSLYALGELYFRKGAPDKAAHYYESALSVKQDAGLLIKLGLYNEYIGKNDSAATYYDQAIKLSPENFIGYNQLAWLYAKQGINLDKALNLAEKANQLQPGNTSIVDTMGWIYHQKGEHKVALKYLEQAHENGASNPTILYHLGVVHKELGNNTLAQELLKSALAISNSFEEAEDAKKMLQ